MRQSGDPYYSHPIEVAYMVSDYLFRTDIIVTSVLHDTIEDTALTQEDISQLFGDKVAAQVMDLTRIKENGIKISAAEAVEILYKEKKYDVLLIKLFDRLHNMQTIGAKSPKKIKKTIAETIIYFFLVGQYFSLSQFTHEIEILSTKFSNSLYCSSTHFSFNVYNLPLLNFQNNLIPTNILDRKE